MYPESEEEYHAMMDGHAEAEMAAMQAEGEAAAAQVEVEYEQSLQKIAEEQAQKLPEEYWMSGGVQKWRDGFVAGLKFAETKTTQP